ncbi:hypothetical protein [Acetobacter persici]|uniref:hypothetical protein n=1 Tax=Acetobacter persici TaxID=1076596 RepID=UPI001F3E8B61|nr:hypothetical protein [Acetobacter persici]MCG0998191.1 hypothetical protein [Acetobacter persici]
MSGTNATDTTASGEPLSSLPAADTVAQTDGIFGVFAGEGKLASPAAIVEAGMPADVVRDNDLTQALSSSALGQYVAQAGQHATDAGADADRAQTAASASSSSASQAAQTGVQVATIAAGAAADADRAEKSQQSAQSLVAGAGTALAQNTALASLVANNPVQFTNRGGWDAAKNSPALTSGTGTEGDLYIVTVSGATALDGVTNWALLDGVWYHGGAWQRLANAGYPTVAQIFQGLQGVIADGVTLNSRTANALTLRDVVGYVLTAIDGLGNISTAGKQLLLGATALDCGAGDQYHFRQRDALGRVLWGIRSDGSPAFPASAARADLGPVSVTLNSYPDGITVRDPMGFILLDTSGYWGAKNIGFTDDYIEQQDRLQLAQSAAIMAATGNLKNIGPIWGYSVSIATGQSEMMGYVAIPALSITQPLDNITFGEDPRGAKFGNDTNPWSAQGGDPSPMPLVAVNVNQDTYEIMDIATPVIYKPATVDVTIPEALYIQISTTDTSVDFTTNFVVGQNIQCSGFTGAAATNNQTGGLWYSNYIRITALTAQSITGYCDGVWYKWNAVAVSGATGVHIAPLRITRDFGEQQSISAMNFYRQLQLNYAQVQTDNARQLALVSTCVSGMPLWNLSKGNDQNVFLRNPQVAQVIKNQAAAAGKTCGLFLIEFCQGGSETTTNYDTYGALLEAYFADIKAAVMPIFGQTADPFIEIVPISGMNMPFIGYNDICRAQVDYAFRTPGAYIATVGYPAIDYGGHYSSNGERYVGAMRAKIRHRVINQRLNWRPLIMASAEVKGSEVLISCHVPYPPMVATKTWRGQEDIMETDKGFGVYDSVTGATIPVTSAEIVGATQIRLTLGQQPTNPIWITYGDANHNGTGNIYDSDPSTSTDVYEWWEGSGAPYSENLPDLIGKSYALPNPMINYGLLVQV